MLIHPEPAGVERGMKTTSMKWLVEPPVTGPRATLFLRFMAGAVFLWEGILKFVYVNQGVGRFTKLGMPFPLVTAPFVAWLEIIGGACLILGVGTRLVTIPFILEMVVAMLSTKPRLYLGTSPLPAPPVPPQVGMWAVLHEIRSEYAQLMTSAFLLFAGPGPASLDAVLRPRRVASAAAPSDRRRAVAPAEGTYGGPARW